MLGLILLLIGGFFFYHCYWKRRNLPPGPLPLPFIGNLYTMAFHEPGYSAYEMWRRKYGPIFTYWIGHNPFIVVADYPSIKRTFIADGETYQDKFNFMEMTQIYRGGNYGVVETNSYVWKEHRRFILHQFREFGLGKNVMEERVMTEVDHLVSKLTELASTGQEVKIQDLIDIGVGSVINQLLFGYRFDGKTLPEFLHLKGLITRQMQDFSSPVAFLLIAYPWLRHFIPFFSRMYNLIIYYKTSFYDFFSKQIEEHEKHIDYSSSTSTDYVDAYLKEKKRREAEGDTESFSYIQLSNLCLDLWTAGMETTSNTLAWAFAYILHNPDVQEKMHKELDKVIGSGRDITMADKTDLVYCNAEVQRMANLLPMNLLHQTSRPVELDGYKLEAGQGMLAQISTVLYDKDIFPEPYEFRPERFVDSDGKLKKVDELIPFSIGKRQCLGEGIARMELFLFTANIFNRFRVSVCGEKPSLKKRYGITVQPDPFKLYAQLRHS